MNRITLQLTQSAVLLLLAVPLGYSDNFRIGSIIGNGTISWTNPNTTGYYTVQWSPSLASTNWLADWSHLTQIPATGDVVCAEVPMFFRAVWSSNWQCRVVEFSQFIATSDGLTVNFTRTLDHVPVVHSRVKVTCSGFELADPDGNGSLTGDGAGIIDYETGAITICFVFSPPVGQDIMVSYAAVSCGDPGPKAVYGYEPAGVGDGATATFRMTTSHVPIPKTLLIKDNSETFLDTMGTGMILGSKGGVASVNYDLGLLEITFWHAPTLGQSVMASYYGTGTVCSTLPTLTLSASPLTIPFGQNQSIVSVVSAGTSPFTWTVQHPASGSAAGSIVTAGNSTSEKYESTAAGTDLVKVTDSAGRQGQITITQQ